MRNIFTLICLLVTVSVVFSQEKVLDNAYLKCQYDHTYLKDTLNLSTRKDLFILQIGENISKCYSYYTIQFDSLVKTPDSKRVMTDIFNKSLQDFGKHKNRNKFLNSFPRTRSRTIVYKNYPQGKMTVTDKVGSDKIIYEDTLNAQSWSITDSTKTVLGYACQQATGNFRGRQWTAWFTTDVPVSDGPWKFGGLPGLIMEVYDKGRHYYFTIIGLEKVTEEPILYTESTSKKGKYIRIDRIDFLKASIQNLFNSKSIMEAQNGISFGKDEPVNYDLIERNYK